MKMWKFVQKTCIALVAAILFVATCFCSPSAVVLSASSADDYVTENFAIESSKMMRRNWRPDFYSKVRVPLEYENGRVKLPKRFQDDPDAEIRVHGRDVVITNDYQTAQLIVKVRGRIGNTFGATEVVGDTTGLYLLQYSSPRAAKAAQSKFERERNVEYVEPNRVVGLEQDFAVETSAPATAFAMPSNRWGAETMKMDNMKAYLAQNDKTDTDIVVAVIGTGVEYTHSFLAARMVDGFDCLNGDADPMDDNGHGTHVAGTIVDTTPNNVKIMPVKVLGGGAGTGSDMNVKNGIDYARENGVKVMNLSLGCTGTSDTLKQAVDAAVNAGITLVAAAGNDERDVAAPPQIIPANYNNVITVSAVKQAPFNQLSFASEFSNFGAAVDVCAPGVGIQSTYLNNGWATAQGTSMAAPHISAAVAMMKLDVPDATPGELKTALSQSTTDLGAAGKDPYYGWGFPDMSKYIQTVAPEFVHTPPVVDKGGDNPFNFESTLAGSPHVGVGYIAVGVTIGGILVGSIILLFRRGGVK